MLQEAGSQACANLPQTTPAAVEPNGLGSQRLLFRFWGGSVLPFLQDEARKKAPPADRLCLASSSSSPESGWLRRKEEPGTVTRLLRRSKANDGAACGRGAAVVRAWTRTRASRRIGYAEGNLRHARSPAGELCRRVAKGPFVPRGNPNCPGSLPPFLGLLGSGVGEMDGVLYVAPVCGRLSASQVALACWSGFRFRFAGGFFANHFF